jgi:hypothetical protein
MTDRTITAPRYSYELEVAVIKGLSGPKMVEFCYDKYTREIEHDHGADHPYYEAHDIIVRKGKVWIITQVSIQCVLSGPQSPLTLVLSLSEHRPVANSSSQVSPFNLIPGQIPLSASGVDDAELW